MNRMAQGRRSVGGLVVLGIAVVFPGPSGGTAWADLRFRELAVNVGEARTGQPLARRFAFVNEGPETVAITDTRASCGCLVPRLERRVYRAGEAGDLGIEVNTLSQAEGPHTWDVHVSYQAGDKVREQQLRVSASVVAEVTVRPAALTIVAEGAAAKDLTLTDRRTRHLAVTAVHPSSPALTARLAGEGRTASGFWFQTVHLQIADDFPEGRHEEVIDLATDDPAYPDLKVPVTVVKKSRPAVAAYPDRVSLTAVASAPLPSALIRLRARDGRAVCVERVVPDDPAISCRWAPGPDTMATLKISVNRGRLKTDRLQSAVHVYFRNPAGEAVVIPVIVSDQ